MVKVFIKNEVNFNFEYYNLYNKIAKYTLEILKIKENSEINVIIVDNKYIQKISSQYKDKNKPTDVLSFSNDWKNLFPIIGYNMFGDIFISYEMVKKQAHKFNHSLKREWSYLFVHGLLHLCGYDHTEKEDEKIMNALAKQVMEKVKVTRDEKVC